MLHFDSTHLKLLAAVARTGSVSKAAEEVHLAVSSASARLKELEERLGVALFERHGRGMRLTPAGQASERYARAMMLEAADWEEEIRRFKSTAGRVVRAATLPNAMATCLPDDVSRFLTVHPEIQVSIQSFGRAEPMLEAVLAGDADLGVTTWPGSFPGLVCAVYWSLELAAFMSPESALARRLQGRTEVDAAELVDEDCIALDPGAALQHMIDESLSAKGCTLKVKLRTQNYADALHFAATGTGFAILPVKAFGAVGHVFSVPLANEWAKRRLRIWHRPTLRSPDCRTLIDFLAAAARSPQTAAAAEPQALAAS